MAKKKSSMPAATAQHVPPNVAANIEVVNSAEASFHDGINNSYGDFATSLTASNPFGQQVSQLQTQFINLRYTLVSNFRNLLSQMYCEHGLIQTLIDAPVDDGFRSGFEIKTDQISTDQIKDLEYFVKKNKVVASLMQAIKWARLFGGGAIILITQQNAATPLTIEKLNQDSKFEFRAVDMWELQCDATGMEMGNTSLDPEADYYTYYGKKIHHSRIFKIKGKEAPSYVRQRLRGWGMSEVERLIRDINSYMKNQDLIFELLDEAKIDVYKIKGMNEALMTSKGTAKVVDRIQKANMVKNFQSAITMDMNDEYEQKQISFAGLGEMLQEIRQGIACAMKMPLTKIFGISASGFNSGEDDIENYNSMVEGEVRDKSEFILIEMLQICCQIKFGMIPDDLRVDFKPLRVMSAKEEEEVKNAQFNRGMSAFQSGAIPIQEFKEAINKNSLLPVEIDESVDALPPLSENFVTSSETKVDG